VPNESRRLFEDGEFYTDSKRANLLFDAPQPVGESPCGAYPFVLLSGRGSSAQWHTLTRTNKSPLLRSLAPHETMVEISPYDAAAKGIVANEEVVVASVRGSMRARAFVTSTIAPGQLFVAMHDATVNQLTYPSFDPHSRQPSYKHAAVNIAKVVP
jgi:ferredoxin-nitrate reductase